MKTERCLFLLCSLTIWTIMGGDSYGQADEDRMFNSDEPIDTLLLQDLCNHILGQMIEEGGSKMEFSEDVMKAADIKLRSPEIKDSTDEDGFYIPAVKIVMQRNGFHPRFVSDADHTMKTICPSIRNFDDSDTYSNIAYRIVSPIFEGSRELILSPGLDYFGIGLYVFDDWERNADGPIFDEPKCKRIDAYFVFVDSGKK